MKQYIPRNDFVLVRLSTVASNGGLILPQMSDQGMKWEVVAIGPKVEDLIVGDEVQMIGTQGEDLLRLPREKDLYISKEANVIYKILTEENLL